MEENLIQRHEFWCQRNEVILSNTEDTEDKTSVEKKKELKKVIGWDKALQTNHLCNRAVCSADEVLPLWGHGYGCQRLV